MLVLFSALGALSLGGCGFALLQNPRTTPSGEVDLTFGAAGIHHDRLGEMNLPEVLPTVQVEVRRGMSESVDLGVRLFSLTGAELDVRWALAGRSQPYALTLHAGGGGAWLGERQSALLLRGGLLAGYDLLSGDYPLMVYAGADLTDFWFFGVPRPGGDSTDPEVERTYLGDGILALHGGVLFGHLLQLEYSRWTRVHDDGADHFALLDSHIVSVGLRWRL